MKTVTYDKLIRDKIPEIIKHSGKEPITDMIPEDELPGALDRKLMEEMQEYLESRSVEEMADILEVLHGIANNMGISWDEVESARVRKRDERGGFEKGIRLIEVRSE